MFSWLWNISTALGLTYKQAKIIFLGLDGSGKTTLLHMLVKDELKVFQPSLYPVSEEVVKGEVKFTILVLPNRLVTRSTWKDYFPEMDGIVFLVDSTDPARFAEAKAELDAALLLMEEVEQGSQRTNKVPFLVLGTKDDAPIAASETELRQSLRLEQRTTGKDVVQAEGQNEMRPIEVFMSSVMKRRGYDEGLRWLTHYV